MSTIGMQQAIIVSTPRRCRRPRRGKDAVRPAQAVNYVKLPPQVEPILKPLGLKNAHGTRAGSRRSCPPSSRPSRPLRVRRLVRRLWASRRAPG